LIHPNTTEANQQVILDVCREDDIDTIPPAAASKESLMSALKISCPKQDMMDIQVPPHEEATNHP